LFGGIVMDTVMAVLSTIHGAMCTTMRRRAMCTCAAGSNGCHDTKTALDCIDFVIESRKSSNQIVLCHCFLFLFIISRHLSTCSYFYQLPYIHTRTVSCPGAERRRNNVVSIIHGRMSNESGRKKDMANALPVGILPCCSNWPQRNYWLE
jgi:hypothetical protein